MVKRPEYLEKLLKWKDEKVIKVVTGIRRCGKSTLLLQFQELLRESGIEASQIISVNFEELENEELCDYRKLYSYINGKMKPGIKYYIFLDELQRVDSYEKAVNSLYVKENTDIYITGSNSFLLSGDLATYLTGRYVEIKMLPLSFKEFCASRENTSEGALAEYMKSGGFPYIAAMKKDGMIGDYLEGIYNTVIIKDIEDRQSRRESNSNKRNINDIVLLKNIAKFLAGSVGSPVSIKSITNYLISNGRKVSANTVDNYVDALCESFVFYKAERFDITGKELLKTNSKLYIVDLGLRNYILPKRKYDLGFSLENIVYFELLRRGYKVNIGKLGNTEVDFVARKNDDIIYYQVTADMTAEVTFEREIRPLKEIQDNYEKTVLTLDRYTPGNYDGIKVINAHDWLLQK